MIERASFIILNCKNTSQDDKGLFPYIHRILHESCTRESQKNQCFDGSRDMQGAIKPIWRAFGTDQVFRLNTEKRGLK